MYSKGEILKILFEGVDVKKSEIRLKSENLHPCYHGHEFNINGTCSILVEYQNHKRAYQNHVKMNPTKT